MSPTKTEDTFQTTQKPQHTFDVVETRGMRVLRDRSTIYKGLCSNCEKLETCTYPSTTSDTWFCEEYSYTKPEKAAISTEEEQQLPETVTGLCMNCELRETCKFPKPAGGVWFCGEYQ